MLFCKSYLYRNLKKIYPSNTYDGENELDVISFISLRVRKCGFTHASRAEIRIFTPRDIKFRTILVPKTFSWQVRLHHSPSARAANSHSSENVSSHLYRNVLLMSRLYYSHTIGYSTIVSLRSSVGRFSDGIWPTSSELLSFIWHFVKLTLSDERHVRSLTSRVKKIRVKCHSDNSHLQDYQFEGMTFRILRMSDISISGFHYFEVSTFGWIDVKPMRLNNNLK